MTDSLSHQFIRSLDEPRDRLYALALARESTPAKAEAALQRTVREQFAAFSKDPYLDVPAAMEAALQPAAPGVVAAAAAMPADVWARLAAAVQIEAAKSVAAQGAGGTGPGGAINPDSVLLNPDPLLAPKRQAAADEDFDLSPSSRFVVSAGIAILIGIALTIYILTRPTTPRSVPLATPLPATSSPSPAPRTPSAGTLPSPAGTLPATSQPSTQP